MKSNMQKDNAYVINHLTNISTKEQNHAKIYLFELKFKIILELIDKSGHREC